MKKKVLSVLLAMCLLVGALPMVASAAGATSGKCGDNVIWSYDTASKALTISGTGPMKENFYQQQPWEEFREDIQTVVVQPGVTSIGKYAFKLCKSLTSVSIPNGVTDLGKYTFSECSALKKVAIPNSVTELDEGLFRDCTALESFTVPGNITSIGIGTFENCTNLKSLTISTGVTSLKEYAIYGTKITSLSIPASLTDIAYTALCSDSLKEIRIDKNNPTYSTDGTTIFNKDKTSVILVVESIESLTIPSTVKIFDAGSIAFHKMPNLRSITLEEGVTAIDGYAFYLSNFPELHSVILPVSLTEIPSELFDDFWKEHFLGVNDVVIGSMGYSTPITLYGYPNSYTEQYAKTHNVGFNTRSDPGPKRPTTAGFKDVFEGEYYADAVKWAVENGITAGTDKTHFSPNASCTRAQAVTFLWRAAGEPEPQNTTTKFNDVQAGSYYEKAVQWAVKNGVTAGTGETTFSPNATCTRAQIVTFLYRAENSPEITGNNSFNDVKTGAYYENAVKWAVENNITSGTGGNKFSPDNNCIRGQIVTFLYRYSK